MTAYTCAQRGKQCMLAYSVAFGLASKPCFQMMLMTPPLFMFCFFNLWPLSTAFISIKNLLIELG